MEEFYIFLSAARKTWLRRHRKALRKFHKWIRSRCPKTTNENERDNERTQTTLELDHVISNEATDTSGDHARMTEEPEDVFYDAVENSEEEAEEQ